MGIIISNIPPKGTSDWFPDEYAIRSYIFSVWRKVVLSFGFQEYMSPILEYSEIYKAKSGEDIGKHELLSFIDRGGRELSLRPEMTPGITRIISRIYNKETKPIKYFSIANFFRNQNTQQGRNREFWQLNYDIFGTESIISDIEIIQIGIEIMIQFGATKDNFQVQINNREFVDDFINKYLDLNENNKRTSLIEILDKFNKISEEELNKNLTELGLTEINIEKIKSFILSETIEDVIYKYPELSSSKGYIKLNELLDMLVSIGYGEYIKYSPLLFRGFDYYNGTVFEMFPINGTNERSLFGGGRYNGLSKIFGLKEDVFAVGAAPGDETTKLFLITNNLLPEYLKVTKRADIYIPLLDTKFLKEVIELSKSLRMKTNYSVECGFDQQSISKAFSFSNKNNFKYVVIIGSDEIKDKTYTIKNLYTGKQVTLPINNVNIDI